MPIAADSRSDDHAIINVCIIDENGNPVWGGNAGTPVAGNQYSDDFAALEMLAVDENGDPLDLTWQS